jgi:hypothetical protein
MDERMDETRVPSERTPRLVVRRSGRAVGHLFPALLALSLAFGSILTTAMLLDTPRARDRLAALWAPRGIWAIDGPTTEPAVELAKLAAERDALRSRLALLQSNDGVVTGSIPRGVVPSSPHDPQSGAASITMKTFFGADLGTAKNLVGLNHIWAGAQPKLAGEGLRPLAAIRDVADGHELRLLVGPVANAADVTRICLKLAEVAPNCTAARFEGQRLWLP